MRNSMILTPHICCWSSSSAQYTSRPPDTQGVSNIVLGTSQSSGVQTYNIDELVYDRLKEC
eukprot:scaffold125466_cov61-Attheya_sp.AAC.1